MIDLNARMTQAQFGELVGISQPAVSDLQSRGVILADQTACEWLKAYCLHLREQAAGRAASGALDLAAERAQLARVQRERIEMQNAVTRRELAPVSLMEEVLAHVGRQIAGILEAIPVQLKRRSDLSMEDITFIEGEIVKARNLAAGIELKEVVDDEDAEEGVGEGQN